MGIEEKQILTLKNSISVGDRFEFRGVTGRVYAKHKNFVVIEKESGLKECFRWIEMLIAGR